MATSPFITILIIYGVSGTFFFPLVALLLLKQVSVSFGNFWAYFVCISYLGWSYSGSPEKCSGRIWLNLNKWWTVSHGYFPVKLKVVSEY